MEFLLWRPNLSLCRAKPRAVVRPRGENCFDEAPPSDFISGVNRFRSSLNPVGTLLLLQVTGRQFSLMHRRPRFRTTLPAFRSGIVSGSTCECYPGARTLLRVSCSRVPYYVRIIGIISRVGSHLRFPADRYGRYSEGISARLLRVISRSNIALSTLR